MIQTNYTESPFVVAMAVLTTIAIIVGVVVHIFVAFWIRRVEREGRAGVDRLEEIIDRLEDDLKGLSTFVHGFEGGGKEPRMVTRHEFKGLDKAFAQFIVEQSRAINAIEKKLGLSETPFTIARD
jgi:hypothetical protein